ncbi:hypothetical protein FQR65_LT10738 [Abscondita terminalis]|nr:hypothetical protein FQR65_LT10738 [Abscondita terminalis]
MDPNVDPCEDFYKFTCGRWTKEHPNHGWYPHYSSFETADERIAVSALNFLQSNISKKDPLPVRQSRDLFLSCMNTEALNKVGYTSLIKYLKEAGLPILPTFFNKSKSENFTFDWISVEVNLKKIFAMDTFVGVLVDADVFNRSRNVIYMGTPGSTCPLPSLLKTERKFHKTTQKNEKDDEITDTIKSSAYKRMVKGIIKMISSNVSKVPSDDALDEAANIIWNITSDLKELLENNETNTDIQFYKLKIDEIQNISDAFVSSVNVTSDISWRSYLLKLFEGVPNVTLDLDNSDYIYVAIDEMSYIPEFTAYISSIPDEFIELYMWWTTVYTMALSTTMEMTDLIDRESEALSTTSIYRSRSIDCATLVINFMGLAVSYGIVDKHFLNNTKPKVEGMLHDIKDAFVHRVGELQWMDKETKRATLEKSKEMISFIGFPEWLLNKSAIENYYTNITMSNHTFLENMMSMITQTTPTQLASLREESERSWKTDPTTVNAYNYFSDNSITVPMAILTYPFYNLGLEVLNYGAIGSILGHELTHGFDNIGRKFDKYGNYKQWWSNSTIETFEDKSSCFVHQYEKFSFPGIPEKINGERTLGENLADNGGLNHAYLAYKNYIRKHGDEMKLPGFQDFSNDQLFFIAFGSIWCETADVESIKYQIENDEHCPSWIRVIGTLQNSDYFANVFKCPLGSKMNPRRTRCRIW